ncbi:Stf0 family sulfotransferase [Sphingomonas sanguinis]|uniref:Stf0 family sulfotransferase n=1 Tax=Sphingomonas sanguinis TaxID=33051 RepID=UPI0009EE5E95|nr:Stf0 family sulfotransferase [Sphingomonas sanguinis]
MIATIPRSGSTFLCLEMWRTGVLGRPMEYLNLLNREKDMIPRLGHGNIATYWRQVQQCRKSDNGVFSFKTFPQDFQQIINKSPDVLGLIGADFVIYLTRRDKIAQAASYWRADRTGSWFAGLRDANKAEYSFNGISTALMWINNLEKRWLSIFQNLSVDALPLFYEDLVDDVNSNLQLIANYCEINYQRSYIKNLPRMEIQRDAKSHEWISAYKDDMQLYERIKTSGALGATHY